MSLEKFLATLKEIRKNEISNFEKKLKQHDETIKKFEMLKDFKEKGIKNKENIEKLSDVLCYHSIAYCGSPESRRKIGKDCPFRNSFLEAIGLTVEDFETYKERCEKLFWEFLKEKGVINQS